MKYRTRDGDRLDVICQQYYQRTDVLPQVLAANPRLAQMGAVLPAGVVITLPDVTAPKTEKEVRLWD